MSTDRKVLGSRENVLNNEGYARGSNSASQGGNAHSKSRPKTSRPSKASFGQPKPPRSAFVCFLDDQKEKYGNTNASDDDRYRDAAAMWGSMADAERAVWDQVAREDKRRFAQETESYKGPKHIPKRRAKKNPLAPKRPPSAFLYFSKNRRELVKRQNPHLINTDISRLLGQMWRSLPDHEREPFETKTRAEHAAYKLRIKDFKEDELRKDAASRTSHSAVRKERSAAKAAAAATAMVPKPASFEHADPLPTLPTIPHGHEHYYHQGGMPHDNGSPESQPRHYQHHYPTGVDGEFEHPYDEGRHGLPMGSMHPFRGNPYPYSEYQRHADLNYGAMEPYDVEPLSSFRRGVRQPSTDDEDRGDKPSSQSNVHSPTQIQSQPYPNHRYQAQHQHHLHQHIQHQQHLQHQQHQQHHQFQQHHQHQHLPRTPNREGGKEGSMYYVWH